MYTLAVGYLVSQDLSLKPAQHLMKHREGISSLSLPHGWTPLPLPAGVPHRVHPALKICPCDPVKMPTSNAKFLGALYFSSFPVSYRRGETKPGTVNTEVRQEMDLTRGKYCPFAKANKTKVQRASKPVCINVTMPGKEGQGNQRTLRPPWSSQGGGERLPWRVPSRGERPKPMGTSRNGSGPWECPPSTC